MRVSVRGDDRQHVVYVAGGIDKPDAVRTMRTFWSLDLKNLDAGWQQLEPWPGAGRMLAVMAAVDGFDLSFRRLRSLAGTRRQADADVPERLVPLHAGPRVGRRRKSAPTGIVAAPVPAIVDEKQIIVFGGDDGARLGFKPPQKHPGFPRNVYATTRRPTIGDASASRRSCRSPRRSSPGTEATSSPPAKSARRYAHAKSGGCRRDRFAEIRPEWAVNV